MSEFKIGDRVRLINAGRENNPQLVVPAYAEYLEKEGTILDVSHTRLLVWVKFDNINEEKSCYCWRLQLIEKKPNPQRELLGRFAQIMKEIE